jgi:pilus assembly protein CpaE
MAKDRKVSDVTDDAILTIAVVDPDQERRSAALKALSGREGLKITEFSSYPPKLDDLPEMLALAYHVVMIDIDTDQEFAFDLAESLSANGRTYVMAYSATAEMRLAVHLMRAGVREFFTLPFDTREVSNALERATAHRKTQRQAGQGGAKSVGKLFTFLGTKGGCGVTTLASNFALALAQESEGRTLLIDLGLPLGDVATNLGIKTEYSIVSALQYPDRLDSSMLSSLVAEHSSTGLGVLAAPSEFPESQPTEDSINKLLAVARQNFEYVVVDVGSRLDLISSHLFERDAVIYLITQIGITELLNANRMISKFFFTRDQTLQIVINRYKSSDSLFDEKTIFEALTRPPHWKIPDDYAAARRTRSTATPMVLIDSTIARAIRHMAKSAAGLVPLRNGKKGFLGFLR